MMFCSNKLIREALIEIQLLHEKVDKMTVNQSQFDAGLATLVSNDAAREAVLQSLAGNVSTIAADVTAIDKAIATFIADYKAANGVDLTNELASVTNLSGEAVSDATALSAAVTAATSADGTLKTDTGNIVAADPNA